MPYSFGAVDEVGQIGFKFEQGSTMFFAATVVLTNEPQTIRDNLVRLRENLKLPLTTEFKFHSTPHSFRLAFLQSASTWPLTARCLYVDKRLLPPDFRRMSSSSFYAFFLAQLLDRLPVGELGNTTLVLDEFGPSQLTLRAVREALRRLGLWGGKTRLLKRMVFRRSRSEGVIQVADVISGAIYRWLTEGDAAYYGLIQNKVLVWEYRPMTTNPPT
jgi:hypothetical protein